MCFFLFDWNFCIVSLIRYMFFYLMGNFKWCLLLDMCFFNSMDFNRVFYLMENFLFSNWQKIKHWDFTYALLLAIMNEENQRVLTIPPHSFGSMGLPNNEPRGLWFAEQWNTNHSLNRTKNLHNITEIHYVYIGGCSIGTTILLQ